MVQDFEYSTLSQYSINGMLYYNERHPLLLKCYITFFSYIKQTKGTSDSIYKAPMGLTVSFSTKIDSQVEHKIQDLRYPLGTSKGALYCKERHPWLLKCYNTFIRYTRRIGAASDSIYRAFMGVNTVPCSTVVNSQIAQKIPDLGYPLSTESRMMCCNKRHPMLMECFYTFLLGMR